MENKLCYFCEIIILVFLFSKNITHYQSELKSMRKVLFFMIVISVVLKGYSQSEFTSKFKAIPPLKPFVSKSKKSVIPPAVVDIPKIETPNVFKSPNVFESKTQSNSSYSIGANSSFSMIQKNDFINPGDEIKDRLNKKEEDPYGKFYRKNQNLGDFRVKSLTAKVMYRDGEYVDGDMIRVYLNGEIVVSQVTLESSFQGFEITLVDGFNKIDFEALNQGSSGPNTAEFQVYNDKGLLVSASQWNLGTGFKATIVLYKEK
jgi:hypothetical protein